MKPLFRFAVVADTHVTPVLDELIPPQVNDRFKHATKAINNVSPAFVIHVGDMVHPIPASPNFPRAAQMFKAGMADISAPFYAVPGNHDVGDKAADYVPTHTICDDYIRLYSENIGEHYYSFDVEDCHFVVINTSLLNSGLSLEAEQRRWLESDLIAHAGRRILMFIHYPPYLVSKDEPGHYDNLDEPGRGWLLGQLERHKVQAVFTGHVHNFFFNRHIDTEIFVLPSSAFVRADYAEMFHIGQPLEHENGRNDPAKLGFVAVDVYSDRLVPQFIRIYEPKENDTTPLVQRDWPAIHPKACPATTLGVDLRYDWTEITDIPYSNLVDEFGRKKARNDYPILSLWEIGARRLRIPLADLIAPDNRHRLRAMAVNGAKFTVFHFNFPDDKALELIGSNAGLLNAVEIILKWPLTSEVTERLTAIGAQTGLPIVVSQFMNANGKSSDGKQVKLLVDHGFSPEDPDLDSTLSQISGFASGVVFRIPRSASAHESITSALMASRRHKLLPQVHLRLSGDSYLTPEGDEWSNAMRVLEGAICSLYYQDAWIFLDTLSDVDRGYYPRIGLVDRLFNPKLGGKVLRNLNGVLIPLIQDIKALEWVKFNEALIAVMRLPERTLIAVLPYATGSTQALTSQVSDRINLPTGQAIATGLVDGIAYPVVFSTESKIEGYRFSVSLNQPVILDLFTTSTLVESKEHAAEMS